jgi:endonuclease/exonuclease/phosphatase family metal-dependent hydrolase
LAKTLRIATFNVLFNHASVGNGCWEDRRRLARRAVDRARPDVIGLQEIFPSMLADVPEIVGDLTIVPGPTNGRPRWMDMSLPIGLALEAIRTGRPPDRVFQRARNSERMLAGMHQPIAYRANRLRPIDSGGFWISPTPDLPSSLLPLAPSPFLVHWVCFERLDAPGRVLVLNAHYGHAPWHHGKSALVTSERIGRLAPRDTEEGRATSVFLVGDFNAVRSSRLVRELTDPRGAALVDALREAPERSGPPVTYHWGRGATRTGLSLDYVLARTDLRIRSAEVIEAREGTLFASDHHAVVVEFGD